MKKSVAILVPLVVVMLGGSAGAMARSERTAEPLPEAATPTTPARERACDCCQKCMAAMKKVDPKPQLAEPKQGEKDGCRDCCDRCGKEKKPSEEAFPPEVVPHK